MKSVIRIDNEDHDAIKNSTYMFLTLPNRFQQTSHRQSVNRHSHLQVVIYTFSLSNYNYFYFVLVLTILPVAALSDLTCFNHIICIIILYIRNTVWSLFFFKFFRHWLFAEDLALQCWRRVLYLLEKLELQGHHHSRPPRRINRLPADPANENWGTAYRGTITRNNSLDPCQLCQVNYL